MTSFEDLVLKIIDLTKNRVVITKTHDNTALAVMLPIKEFYKEDIQKIERIMLDHGFYFDSIRAFDRPYFVYLKPF
jgi:hypothetical protein